MLCFYTHVSLVFKGVLAHCFFFLNHMAETEQAVNTTQTLSPCKVFTVSVLSFPLGGHIYAFIYSGVPQCLCLITPSITFLTFQRHSEVDSQLQLHPVYVRNSSKRVTLTMYLLTYP